MTSADDAAANEFEGRSDWTRILVFEAPSIDVEGPTDALRVAGFAVSRAWTVEQTLTFALAGRPALLLLDLDLRASACEAVARLHAMRRFESLPVILVGSPAGARIRHALGRARVAGHLAKPVNPGALYAMVFDQLDTPSTQVPFEYASGATDRGFDAAWSAVSAGLTGIDTDRGLRFFAGNAHCYRTALMHFASMYANGILTRTTHGTRRPTEGGDPIRRALHALVGACGAIGALELVRRVEVVDALAAAPDRASAIRETIRLNTELVAFTRRLHDDLPSSRRSPIAEHR